MNYRQLLRKVVAVLLGMLMTLSFGMGAGASVYAASDDGAYDELAEQQKSEEAFSFREGQLLNRMRIKARSYPSSFDLRNVDTQEGKKSFVTPVRIQNPFGTCWGFAAIAAAESSLIADGLADQTIDLSEKQLAYFATSYVDDPSDPQNGEGWHFRGLSSKDLKTSAYRYNTGGTSLFATSVFASGIGPVEENAVDPETGESLEAVFGYRGAGGEPVIRNVAVEYNPDGSVKRFDRRPVWPSIDDDWSIPDKYRNRQSYRLKDSYILPGIVLNSDGSLDEDSLLGIKQQLKEEHRAVSVNFCAESYVPGQDTSNKVFMNSRNWAHYTFRPEFANHSVTIVGWDDNYPKENFRHEINEPGYTEDDTVPPGDGAFLIKNSWGAETNGSAEDNYKNNGFRHWGLLEGLDNVPYDPHATATSDRATGYFWISYYDKSINDPETFVFEKVSEENTYDIAQTDMAHTAIPSIIEGDGCKSANVFTAERTSELKEISVMTAIPGTRVNYAVYILPENYDDPENGVLVTRGDKSFTYGGYHNISLDETAILARDQKYSVVITAESDGAAYFMGGNNVLVKYAYRSGSNESPYTVTVVNKGESYLFDGSDWLDLADEDTQREIIDPDYAQMDNFPIKAYLKPVSGAYLAVDNWSDGTPGSFDLTVGYSKNVTAEFRGLKGAMPDSWPEVTWESSDDSIVTVTPKTGDSGEAKLTAVSEGKAYITVTAGEYGTRVIGINAEKPQIDDFHFKDWNDEFEYTGKAIEPEPIDIWVFANGDYEKPDLTEGVDYTVEYSNNIKPGEATVTVKGIGIYGGSCTQTFTILKADEPVKTKVNNTLRATGRNVKLKALKLKKRKQVIKAAKAYNVKAAQGKTSYRKLSVSKKKYAGKFKVNSKTGNITVGKGVKKGKYKVRVQIKAAGDKDYKPASKTVTVNVIVR